MVIRNKSWADAQLEWRAESVSRNGTLVTLALGSSTVPYQVSTPGTPFSPLDGSAAFISPLLEMHTPKPQRQIVWTEITQSHNKDHQGCHTDGLRAEWVPQCLLACFGDGESVCVFQFTTSPTMTVTLFLTSLLISLTRMALHGL